MNIIYNILILSIAGTLLGFFIYGAIKDSKKTIDAFKDGQKKHQHKKAAH